MIGFYPHMGLYNILKYYERTQIREKMWLYPLWSMCPVGSDISIFLFGGNGLLCSGHFYIWRK